MSLKQLQTFVATAIAVITLTGLAIKYGRDQETAERDRNSMRDRIRALERIEYSEHPEWAQAIYFATGERPESK